MRKELPSGTTIELGVDQVPSNSDRAPEQQAARVSLTLTQALLRSARPADTLSSVRQAELGTAASRQELRGFVESLRAETEISSWRYQLARRTIEIVERSLEVARQQDGRIRQQIEVGVLPRQRRRRCGARWPGASRRSSRPAARSGPPGSASGG